MQDRLPNILIFFFTLSLLLISCGLEEEEIPNDTSISDYLATSSLSYQQTASGLYYNINLPGADPKVSPTNFCVLDLRGQLLNGTSLGNSFGTDANVRLDLNLNLIAGLKEGIQLLGQGGRGTFILPPNLAFGSIGSNGVPPNAPVLYEIQILNIYDNDMAYSDSLLTAYIATNGLQATKTSTGLYVVLEEAGSDEKPTSSQNVTVHYEGYFLDGTVFDSSIARGSPSSFNLGGVIAGWTEGIPYFGIGGKGKLLIPSHLAYGAQGNSNIPSFTPLVFDIELIGIN